MLPVLASFPPDHFRCHDESKEGFQASHVGTEEQHQKMDEEIREIHVEIFRRIM